MGSDWKNYTITEKILTVLTLIAACAVLTFIVLRTTGIWESAFDPTWAIIAFISICEAFVYKNKDRKIFMLTIGAAIASTLVAVLDIISLF